MKYSAEYVAQVKADFLRSISAGWSVQVSMVHAGCYDNKFRKMFSGDEEIQKLLYVRREISKHLRRGYIRRIDENK